MNFIEETLGAQLVRKITFSLAVLAGIFALTVLIINDEVVSGLLVLYTGQETEIIGKNGF